MCVCDGVALVATVGREGDQGDYRTTQEYREEYRNEESLDEYRIEEFR